MIINISSWNILMAHLCGWSAVALLFSAPFSRSLYILSGLLFVISWFAQKDLYVRLIKIKSLPIAKPALVLSFMVLVWATWSSAPFKEILNNLKVYSKLIMLLMLAVTLSEDKWRKRAWWGLVAGMTFVLFSTFANVFINLPWSMTQNQGLGADHSVFVEYVSQSVMTSVFMAFTLQHCITSNELKMKVIWGLATLCCFISIMFLLQGRSGLVACSVVFTVFALFYTPKSRRLFIMLLLISTLTLLVVSSPLMLSRVLQAYNDVVQYRSFDATSLGLRVDMWLFALKSFYSHPFIGTGVGTYPQLAASHFSTLSESQLIYAVIHPHNQYLFFAMEYGVLGLIGFLWLLWQFFKTAYVSHNPDKSILIAVTLVLAVDSIYNVPLWYRAESYFFYAVLALLVASNFKLQDNEQVKAFGQKA